ncbi:MAG TPA: SDR family oxidoreductase [Candidatus Dormibacteraeota bacterium]|nr:SDR family oxidoreductase [Candidatus Dormibacteraeota bacterium]
MAGRVAIVTGAGSRAPGGIGNGRATSVVLARAGARVALLDTVREWADETLEMVEREGGAAFVLETDVTDPEACRAAVAETVRRWSRVDVLVNNVGIGGPPGTAVDVDLDEWDRAMRVNVTSMVLMARCVIPEMRAAGGGAIVNLGSVAGLTGGHPNLLYPTSKGAVVQMTRAMAAHHGREGIRVNCICPGMVYTPMVYARGMSEETRNRRRRRSLLQTEGTGWDVANAVLYLASDEARWVTGMVLTVDAGATAGMGSLPVPTTVR